MSAGARFVLGLLLVLALLEGGARALAPLLPDARPWPTPETELKVHQMESQRKSGGIVIVGTSVSEAAIDPAIVGPRVETDVYNAALPFVSLVGIELWLEEFVIPLTSPDTVVVGLLPYGLGSNAEFDPVTNGLKAVLRKPGPIERTSVFVGRRGQFRNFLDVLRRNGPDPSLWTDDGHQTGYYDGSMQALPALTGSGSGGGRLTEESSAGLRRIVQKLRGARIGVVLLIEPGGCPPAISDCPRTSIIDANVRDIAAIAEELDVPVINGRDLDLQQGWFADPSHFNREGTVAFSEFIAAEFGDVVRDLTAP